MTAESLVFVFLAAMAVTTALLMILRRNPVICAISLIANFFCLAGLYLLLRAQLLAVLEIAVYAGAIMVLVVFVIMLLNQGDERKEPVRHGLLTIVGAVLVAGFLVEMVFLIVATPLVLPAAEFPATVGTVGSVEAMGATMFTRYLFPFEMTGMLLLAAVVGAVILAKKRLH